MADDHGKFFLRISEVKIVLASKAWLSIICSALSLIAGQDLTLVYHYFQSPSRKIPAASALSKDNSAW